MPTNTNEKIRVIIAENHAILRQTVKLVFDRFSSKILVVAEVENGKDLVDKATLLAPDVIITDIEMPLMTGVEATRIIISKQPGIGVIAFSMNGSIYDIKEMIDTGARGYLLKDAGKQDLIAAVETVYNGGTYFCEKVGCLIRTF